MVFSIFHYLNEFFKIIHFLKMDFGNKKFILISFLPRTKDNKDYCVNINFPQTLHYFLISNIIIFTMVMFNIIIIIINIIVNLIPFLLLVVVLKKQFRIFQAKNNFQCNFLIY
ncbi:transmembrane protein, putative (macronuclear) [Tetrahymena thermophila SB210]|uniref:Transmembrane protein, putative n=1 Tax=Tetrahymena thermophila (strain SB210) TaxID=312017 RepID=W7XBC7_TETTS|nr:transmembrane protein, putative [Tetrahymena thermophila SB210]EWS74632.1 transmembrane protein, putative [Tetrahymena thermophila SB210]|eukprot:XP_012652854.1 transmembrane protein, putative [Tetrahymena thermophila SB210]